MKRPYRVLGTLSCLFAVTLIPSVAVGGIVAAGGNAASVDETFTQVNFGGTFDTAPVVIALGGDDGGTDAPAGVRIRNVTATGFEVAHVEPDDTAGAGTANGDTSPTDIHWFALAHGQHTIGGVRFEAFTHDTQQVRGSSTQFDTGGGFDTVNFGAGNFFQGAGDMLLLSSLQTMENEEAAGGLSSPWLQTVVDTGTVTTTEADVSMERAEVTDGASTAIDERITTDETIGLIAIEEGAGTFEAQGGITVLFDALLGDGTGSGAVGGPEDNPNTVAFTQAFVTAPLVAGSQMSVRGSDGGWLGRVDISTAEFEGVSQEDRHADTEVMHAIEDVALFAFSEGFVLVPEPSSVVLALLGLCGMGLALRRRFTA